MNSIIGFTKVLLRTDLSAKQKEYLNAIKISGDTLIELINDILDLQKVDSGKMIFEQTPFKMLASVSAILHLFEKKIQEKNSELVGEYDHRIRRFYLATLCVTSNYYEPYEQCRQIYIGGKLR